MILWNKIQTIMHKWNSIRFLCKRNAKYWRKERKKNYCAHNIAHKRVERIKKTEISIVLKLYLIILTRAEVGTRTKYLQIHKIVINKEKCWIFGATKYILYVYWRGDDIKSTHKFIFEQNCDFSKNIFLFCFLCFIVARRWLWLRLRQSNRDNEFCEVWAIHFAFITRFVMRLKE